MDNPINSKDRSSPAFQEQETDFKTFYSNAHDHIGETDYHRGLSTKTLDRFCVGFVPDWRHPRAGASAAPSPRIIIPVSDTSYFSRDTRQNLDEESAQYAMQYVGGKHIFNASALFHATRPIFLVEGEIDALSIIDVGGEAISLGGPSQKYKNVVKMLSSLLREKSPSQPIIIAMDNDDAGRSTGRAIQKELDRLGVAAYIINPYGSHKDANDALVADRESLRAAVRDAEEQAKAAEDEKKRNCVRPA